MKVALCISGQPRNAYRGIENILQNMKFNFDVVCVGSHLLLLAKRQILEC